MFGILAQAKIDEQRLSVSDNRHNRWHNHWHNCRVIFVKKFT